MGEDALREARRLQDFQNLRSLLFTVGYRMLGSASDAEDAVQEAWLRWSATDAEVRDPRAYLIRTVTRLCIDQLRSARVQRERYVGPWLPEPVLTDTWAQDPFEAVARDEALSLGAVVLLERLSPAERAVFVLRDGLALGYDEIAEIVGVTATNARQLLHRARTQVAEGSARFAVDDTMRQRLIQALREAFESGDLHRLISVLHADVVAVTDGGGRTRVALRPVIGADRVLRFLAGAYGKAEPGLRMEVTQVNGRLALVMWSGQAPAYVLDIGVEDGLVRDILVVANPDKLEYAHSQSVSAARVGSSA